MSRTIVLCVLLLGTPALLRAQLPIFDDFEDGSATDGDPAMWNPGFGGTRHVSDDGDYIMTASDLATSLVSGTGGVRDVSIRTRLRLLEGGAGAGIFARNPAGDEAYWGAILKNGKILTTEERQTSIDILAEDALLQFDVFGDEISLTAWAAEGSEKPSVPQMTFHDDAYTSGRIGLLMNGFGINSTVAFRWFQAVASDFDCNGDALLNEADLPCVATVEDRDDVLEALQTLPGDLDGDGEVAFADFVVLAGNYGQDLPSYTDGNIDLQDGVGFEDFVILATNFGKTPSGLAAVPEPHGLAVVMGLLCLIGWWRKE